ncbi:MAG: histidinol dehydrogenase [Papillibacter sp.]|nr:histidinol dehydrogenase [Papillibacter sp.]
MISITSIEKGNEAAFAASLRGRAGKVNEEIQAAAADILEKVRTQGYPFVEAFSIERDGAAPRELSKAELEGAKNRCSKELIASLELAADNIRNYQSRLVPKSQIWETENGVLGQLVRGLERVGIYVPGGVAAYPSSVLMNAVPAKVAGVEELIMFTPPTKYLNDAVMAAALIAGVDRVIAIGGPLAVAAAAYGAGFIPKVDKLVGPGNAYVTAAKRLAFGLFDIDMTAGPSEVLVIADDSADPVWVAADLLSQAEHDPLAAAVLVTDSKALAERVQKELDAQLSKLSRREIAEASINDYGAIVLCPDLNAAVRLANEIAPEHLEIMTEKPEELMLLIKNAGAIFLGSSSPEPLGDYLAGPSHVLPTSGTARFFSPVSVETFIKRTSLIGCTREALKKYSEDIIRLAESEGLDAHANSIRVRFK